MKPEMVERVARFLHERYVAEAATTDAEPGPAFRAWVELDETYRQSNRDAALRIGPLFAAAGLSIEPDILDTQETRAEEIATKPALEETVEALARLEHERWMAERMDRGWRYGAIRDEARKHHPSLVPYDALPESEREKDRKGVRAQFDALRDAGLRAVIDKKVIDRLIEEKLRRRPGVDRVPRPRLALRIGFTGHRPNRLEPARLAGHKAGADGCATPDDHNRALQGAIREVMEGIERGTVAILRDDPYAPFFADAPPLLRLVTGAAAGADRLAIEAAAGLRGPKRSVVSRAKDDAVASSGREAEWQIDMIVTGRPSTFVLASAADVVLPADLAAGPVAFQTRYWRETFAMADTIVSLPPQWTVPDAMPVSRDVTVDKEVSEGLAAAFGEPDTSPRVASGHRLSLDHRRAGDFQFRQSDMLVAIWDGERANGPGGTPEVMHKAVQAGMPVIWIDPRNPTAPPQLITAMECDGLERAAVAGWCSAAYAVTSAPIEQAGDGPLHQALLKLIALPADAFPDSQVHKDSRSERRRLADFLAETWPRETAPGTYDTFQKLMRGAGHRIGEWRDFLSPRTRKQDGAHWADKQWTEYIKGNPEEGLQGVALKRVLFPAWAFADHLAVKYAGLYRAAFVRAYIWAALAVMVALLGFLLTPMVKAQWLSPYSELPLKSLLVALELWIIWRIYRLVVVGEERHWHNKSVEYRGLAESLRRLRFLAPLGEFAEAGAAAREPVWWTWYLKAVARNIGLPQGHLDARFQKDLLLSVRRHELEGKGGQIEYNQNLSRTAKATEHGAHGLGQWLFGGTMAFLAMWLIAFLAALVIARPGATDFEMSLIGLGKLLKNNASGIYAALDAFKPILGVIAALLPTVGAALAAIRFTADFDGRSARANATSRRLRQDLVEIEKAITAPEFERTRRALLDVSETLAEDVSAFLWLYGRKSLQTPG